MQDARTTSIAVRALTAGALGLAACTLLATPAQAACEGYSGACVTGPPSVPPTSLRPRPPVQLENTGAETALLVVIGLGAVGGGTALVIAGRRRSQRPASA